MIQPKPLPAWFWPWVAWRDKNKQGPRPKNAPARIPVWAHVRYLLHRGIRPKPRYTGLFTGNGVFLRGPGGESEDVAAMDAAGFSWVAGNIGDHHADSWSKIRLRCSQYGLSFLPWLRCLNNGMTLDQAERRTARCVQTAQQWGSRALILNLEDEAWNGEFPPGNAQAVLEVENWRGETAVSTVGYPPAWPDWKALNAVGLMQAFMNVRADLLPKVCVDRGIECGFTAAFPTFGTYPAAVPWSAAMYRGLWNGPYSVYTGDNIGADQAWKEWA